MYLYKYVKNNEVIYIGKTRRDINKRIKEHFQKRDLPEDAEIYVYRCSGEAYMNVMEILLIDKYRPKYNKDCHPIGWEKADIQFKEPAFIKWEEYNKMNNVYNYGRNNRGNITAYMLDGTERRPEYCQCTHPVPEKNINSEGYVYDICVFCNKLIKGTFTDLNLDIE